MSSLRGQRIPVLPLATFRQTQPAPLARPIGELKHKLLIGAEGDLLRNIHAIAEVAGLDGDELGLIVLRTVMR